MAVLNSSNFPLPQVIISDINSLDLDILDKEIIATAFSNASLSIEESKVALLEVVTALEQFRQLTVEQMENELIHGTSETHEIPIGLIAIKEERIDGGYALEKPKRLKGRGRRKYWLPSQR